jgi:hypothetical protein
MWHCCKSHRISYKQQHPKELNDYTDRQQQTTTGLKKEKEKKKKREIQKRHFSTLMCFDEDALIFFAVSSLYSYFVSLTLFFAVQLTASKCTDVSFRQVVKKYYQERKRKIETTNYTIPKKSEKRTRHTSASSTMILMIFADNQRYIHK